MPKTPELFNEIATHYELWSNALSAEGIRAWHRFAVDTMHLAPGLRVLDVGCGTGSATRLMAQRVGVSGEVVGLDPAETMLAQARTMDLGSGSTAIQWVGGQGEHLPFESARFDRVTAQFSLRNMEDWVQGVREMVRVLKDHGQLTILEMVQPMTPLGAVARRGLGMVAHLAPLPYQWLETSLQHAPTTEELRGEVMRLGVRSIATHHWLGDLVVVLNGVKESTPPVVAPVSQDPTVVWGVDGSVTALHVAKWINECMGSGATVHIVSVIPPTSRESRVRETDRHLWVQQQTKAHSLLVAERYHIETHLLTGDPGPLLVQCAQDTQATWVVVGRKPRNSAGHYLLGRVAQYVATHATRPVLLIPTDLPDRERGIYDHP